MQSWLAEVRFGLWVERGSIDKVHVVALPIKTSRASIYVVAGSILIIRASMRIAYVIPSDWW